MNQDKIRELTGLLQEAMDSLEIRDSSSLLPIKVYRQHLQQSWTSYSENSLWILERFKPHIVNETIKTKLLDFIREQLAAFIQEDRILSASYFIFGGSPNGFHLNSLLEQLLKIAICRGAKGAVSTFDKCTENTQGSVQYMALLEGIKLKSEIQVFEGIRLIPLPSSTSDLPHYLPNFFHRPAVSLLGKTLLIIDYSVSPIFHKPLPTTITMQEHSEQINRIFRVELKNKNIPKSNGTNFSESFFCQALSLACNSAVQSALKWKFLAKDELFNLNGYGGGITWRSGPFGSSTEATEAQIDEAKRLYDILVNLDSNVKKKLQIPLDRWIKSKTYRGSVDKMIDLGIAFESLYLSDIGDETTELSLRLRLHASWYLGKNKKKREELMKEFREIYKWRSKAVHTGALPTKEKRKSFTQKEVAEFIEKAQDLCRQSIIKIMKDGRFPHWSSLILGEKKNNL